MTAKGAAQFFAASSGAAAVPGHGGPPAQSKTPGELPGLADSSELAKQVAGVAAAQEGLTGARLWRLANGKLTIWEESGHLPPANEVLAEKALTTPPGAGDDSAHWIGALAAENQVFGVLEARGATALSEKTRSSLELLLRIAGVAMASADRRHAVDELSTIIEATKLLNSTLDLGHLINIILQLSSRLIGAERGTVFLLDRERDEIWSLAGLGLEEQQEIRLPTAKGIAGWVARHGETARLEEAYLDPRFEPEVDRRLGYQTRSLLCLPIHNKDGDVVGVLELLNKKGGTFSASDEGALRPLSDQVALALENARLHRELLAKQRMERDLELARSIQRGLLPEHPPRLEGFEIGVAHAPSQMVGGDYYDFVMLDPHTLLAVIADVEGKGVASALVMANLQATLRALAAHLHALEHIVSSVNDMILADTRAQKYLSMFVGLLDRHRALHYINAGHVPPVVIRADGSTVALREGGMVVGMFPNVVYKRGYVQLAPGDVVAGYTDGITEAADPPGNEYGLERLVDAVRRQRTAPAEQIVENVLSEVDRFSRGGPHDDDRVILVLKVL